MEMGEVERNIHLNAFWLSKHLSESCLFEVMDLDNNNANSGT